jgi:hypothetical protein
MRRTRRFVTPCAVTLAALALAACGGSAKTTTSTPPKPAATATTTTASAPTSSVTTGPVRASLRASDHTPVANRNWPFTVTVTDPSGHPLSGTVTVQFVFAGQVVGRDTPPTHDLKNGRWHELLKFPPRSVGIPLNFQTVVRTSAGAVTLSWPVRVKP